MDRLLRDPRAWGLMLAATLTIMSNSTITPALPGLQARFADDPNADVLTRLLITAPSLMVAIIAPFAGLLTDRLGRRKPLFTGLLIYAVAGTAGLYLDSLQTILVSRLILGIGVAFVMTAQAALIGDYFQGAERGRLMGYQIAATNVGGLMFVTVAGYLAGIDPSWPFIIYGLAIVMLPFLWMTLPEPTAAMTGHDPSSHGAAQAEPGWQLTVTIMAIAAALTFVIFYAVPTQLPYHLRGLGMRDPQNAGVAMASMMFAAAITSVVSGWIRPWLGRVGTPVTGYLLMASGFGTVAAGHTLGPEMLGMALIGAGIGMCMPTFITTALNVTPARHRGLVSGLVTAAIFLGQFLSPLASQPLVTHLGYSGAFYVGAVGYVILAILLILILRRKPRQDPVVRTT